MIFNERLSTQRADMETINMMRTSQERCQRLSADRVTADDCHPSKARPFSTDMRKSNESMILWLETRLQGYASQTSSKGLMQPVRS